MLTLDHNPRVMRCKNGPGTRLAYRYVLRNGEDEAFLTGRSVAILTALIRTAPGYATDRLLKALARGVEQTSLRKHPDFNCGLLKHIHLSREALAKLGEPDALQRVGAPSAQPLLGGYRLVVPIEIIPSELSPS